MHLWAMRVCTLQPLPPQAPTNMYSVGLNHFTLGRVVGKGAFGKVRIVEHKYTKLTFALKYIRKDDSQSQYTRTSETTPPDSA